MRKRSSSNVVVFLVFVVVVVSPSPSTKRKTTEEEFAILEMRVKKVGCKLQECVVHIDDCKEKKLLKK